MKKILLVDDEQDIVEFLKYNLEQEDFEVVVGVNGEDAISKLNENPDLIILDIMMPKMDGFETCKKIRARVKSNFRKSEALSTLKAETIRIKYGPIDINKEKYEVFVDGDKKVFPRKEFEVLYFLINNPGRVFGRELLLKEVWGSDVFVVDRTVDVHVRKIREKLGKHSDIIETVKGVGYRLKSVE